MESVGKKPLKSRLPGNEPAVDGIECSVPIAGGWGRVGAKEARRVCALPAFSPVEPGARRYAARERAQAAQQRKAHTHGAGPGAARAKEDEHVRLYQE